MTRFQRLRCGRLPAILLCLTSAVFALAGAAFGADLYVDPAGVDAGCVAHPNPGNPYLTIQNALVCAAPGDIIHVAAGTYTGQITLSKSVTLLGAQAGVDACGRSATESIISGGAGLTSLTLITGSAGAIIDGFTFSGGNRAIESSSGPINNLVIRNNRVVGFINSGIFLNDNGIDVTVHQNLIDGTSKTGAGDLVHLDQDNFDGFVFTDNCVQNSAVATGLFVDGNHNVGTSGARAPLISGNVINATNTGMNLGRFAFEFGTISGNTFSNALFDGVQGGIQNSSITNNIFSGNGRSGLALTGFGGATDATRGAQNSTITNNTFSANVSEGLLFSSGQFPGTVSTNVAHNNNFTGNGTGGSFDGVFYSGTETLNLTCNWWNSIGGPDHPSNPNPPADDIAAANAMFTPWLGAAAPGGLCNQYGGPNNVHAVVDSCISATHPCETVDMLFTRADPTPLRGYSVTFQLSPELALCSLPATTSISQGPYLGSFVNPNGTVFQVVDNGGGSYTVDNAILGLPCGQTGSGILFRVRVRASGGNGVGTISVTSVTARNCVNATIPGIPGAPAAVAIDTAPTAAITNLAATQLTTGNDGDGTTKIQITYTTPAGASQVKVYRAGFGNYPEYDDAPLAGSIPVTPTYPPPAPWALTGVTASGQFDEVLNRDYWYFVAFAVDSCGNVSLVSNKTTGTLNYHLGDVHNGVTNCQGNNLVNTSDISFLGAHYAITLVANDVFGCLDVGPTTTNFVDGRPLTDNKVQFEDLILFAINYATVSKPLPAMIPAARDEISVLVPEATERGQEFSARLWLRGTGKMQGLTTQLVWNPAVVEPVGVEAGDLLDALGGVAFSASPGGVDAALLGVRPVGLAGEGELARVHFRVIGAGNPAIAVATVDARDRNNQHVDMRAGMPADDIAALPHVTELLPNVPNPFNPSTKIAFLVAAAGAAEVDIFTVSGRLVRTLSRGDLPAGLHEVIWDGNDDRNTRVASGTYYVRLRAAGVTRTRPIVMLK